MSIGCDIDRSDRSVTVEGRPESSANVVWTAALLLIFTEPVDNFQLPRSSLQRLLVRFYTV